MKASDVQWLVTGAGGLLATDVVRELEAAGARVRALPRSALDITDPPEVAAALAGADVIVNCAGYTAVDGAEADEEAAHRVNALGPQVLAQAAVTAGARLVHISTDYVFAGDAMEPYAENAPPSPLSAYGRSKAAGEAAIRDAGGEYLIVRTEWLYGEAGACFPRTIARVGAERGALEVVDDQIGQPTWSRDVARFVIALVERDVPSGIYHGTASGKASWFEFAREICFSAGLGDIVAPVPGSKYPRAAKRPAWSVLGHSANESHGVPSIGDWKERWHAAAPEVLGADDPTARD